MFNVGPLELMVLVVLALIVFGPAKLPELMASAGNAIREFQRASQELTQVFQETQQEFSSALDLDATDTTVTEPAAEPSANGHATTEVASTVPVVPEVPVTTAPAEFETAAAMIDPVDPYPVPATAVEPSPPEPAVPVSSAPAEFETAAGLFDDAPPPFEIKLGPTEPVVADAALADAPAAQPVAGAESATEPSAAAVAGAEPPVAEPVAADAAAPIAKVRRPRRPRVADMAVEKLAGESGPDA